MSATATSPLLSSSTKTTQINSPPIKRQIKVPATYMRGGTSKGVFFLLEDLPQSCQQPGPIRDAFLLRVIGSPDAYGKHTDGMGGATSSTSKVVIVSPASKAGHDVDYLFGQVAIDKAVIDWSGNCGNLTAAVGAFSIHSGLIANEQLQQVNSYPVRIWQVNIGKTIISEVPVTDGQVQETGDFLLDGVSFAAAKIKVNFISPVAADRQVLPTGNTQDTLHVPDVGDMPASFINAGIPTIFIPAHALGFSGTECQEDWNSDAKRLAMLEVIRLYGAVSMGLSASIEEAAKYQHIPKLAFVAPPSTYVASSGKTIAANTINLLVRALSMGKMHHAMMGTAAVAIASAAAIEGTVVHQVLKRYQETDQDDSQNKSPDSNQNNTVVFGHPSGTLTVGAYVSQTISDSNQKKWTIDSVQMSRSARVLMDGRVWAPADVLISRVL